MQKEKHFFNWMYNIGLNGQNNQLYMNISSYWVIIYIIIHA